MRAGQVGSEFQHDRDGTVSSLTVRRALVRRIIYRKPDLLVDPLAKSQILCHVQWLRESSCGSENELFLRDGACQDLKLCLIRSAESIYIGKRGPVVDRALLR